MHVKVRVKTGAKNESIREVSEGKFEIAVREKPEANMANERVVELVALYLKVPVKRVRIVKGHHHPSKILSVAA
ncbi:hypothetical protein A3C20_04755 [Candidatus Kaiserbacteria bacterium RIFCSPHIGHO2_02_FULL_55_25]|uniref:Uncharacterized protein n=1 Tax=Candidatus Kaiserbacteria bacterium RIFCSPHIGHO2_02_FULL_55_25 TaxID=1798498 RepID=A0A1F6EB39_9BACT|nr:MAG: hypothetical protein A2764_02210 [Candidatus Kaiserbacteria bacterium RIFCSPHIGHO2_01_FULL_55_79]OGG70800.1 MAG: hypothetical protein A3C20_04755 [Candidatus Kaiserbacteria bacterium RIFCSPHIGHO2_02_FULL_55_25]OGG77153.1 MAG: hypothetical protein A3F56_04785 [Candidatus Kaiserbacteria bacterium RIFCSPHIGHO2_12_FULL_55_13]OGG83407.1 MAG: hypothetical protein A3A42_04310 [Candidatus Kaiserbacteria bacterium RIFCSPLOWO2_01_FULL_55_25]